MRSRYPRKIDVIGTTVAAQETYDWPADCLLPLSLKVGESEPWEPADPDTIRAFKRGGLELLQEGAWYDTPGADGVRKLGLYPPPTDGLSIELEWVYRPVPLVNDSDEPSEYPEEFHPGLAYEAAAVYFEMEEDNPELGQRNLDKAEAYVTALIAYGNEREVGRGIFIPPIAGATAPR